jgi:hypothetical protein
MAIMGRHEIDWPLLVEQARRREVTLGLGIALGYLRSTLDAPIPPEVVDELRRNPRSRVEAAGYRAATGDWDLRGVTRWHWFLCRQVTPSRTRAILDFPKYMQLHLGYDRRRDLARHVVGRLTGGPKVD